MATFSGLRIWIICIATRDRKIRFYFKHNVPRFQQQRLWFVLPQENRLQMPFHPWRMEKFKLLHAIDWINCHLYFGLLVYIN